MRVNSENLQVGLRNFTPQSKVIRNPIEIRLVPNFGSHCFLTYIIATIPGNVYPKYVCHNKLNIKQSSENQVKIIFGTTGKNMSHARQPFRA